MQNPATRKTDTLIIGASDNPSRYAYLAMRMLEDHGYPVHLVSPRLATIDGRPVHSDITSPRAAQVTVDTVTLYVGPTISARLGEELVALAPRRVIFNPGAENEALRVELSAHGIETIEGCTLVLLQTGQF